MFQILLKNIAKCLFLSSTLLAVDSLWAQSYTQSQMDRFLEDADTIIYRNYPPYDKAEPINSILVVENEGATLDWALDTLPMRTLFAVKTNLLYDLVTAINIELEIPIGDRYSIAGEWIFPWWLSDSRQRSLEILSGAIEGRYWLGDRSQWEQLTGWSLGVYIGAGYYDLEWDGNGYQGEHLISGGISAGYTYPIGTSLRLEGSIGIGFISTKYREYEATYCGEEWRLIRERSGRANWFGPTRLRISLAWMINRKDKRGGRL